MTRRRGATKRKQAAFVAAVCLIGVSIGTVAAYSLRWSENAAGPIGERKSQIGRLSGSTTDAAALDADAEGIATDTAEGLIGADEALPQATPR